MISLKRVSRRLDCRSQKECSRENINAQGAANCSRCSHFPYGPIRVGGGTYGTVDCEFEGELEFVDNFGRTDTRSSCGCAVGAGVKPDNGSETALGGNPSVLRAGSAGGP